MDERLRILKMVEDSTITAEQAAELMKAMGVEAEQTTAVAHRSYDKKMFRIIVDSTGGDKVNIQFPVGAVKKVLKATGKLPLPEQELQGMDLSAIMEAVSECRAVYRFPLNCCQKTFFTVHLPLLFHRSGGG